MSGEATPSLTGPLAAATVEAALHLLLAADPTTQAELAALAPRRLDLELDLNWPGGPRRLSLLLREDGVGVAVSENTVADAAVQMTPTGFMSLLASRRTGAALPDGVRITGDSELIAMVFAVLARYRLDLESPLARLIGEAPSAALGAAARYSGQEARRLAEGSAQAVRDCLTATGGPLPARHEVMRYLDDVDDLRLSVDRIKARLQLLQGRLEPPEGTSAP